MIKTIPVATACSAKAFYDKSLLAMAMVSLSLLMSMLSRIFKCAESLLSS